MSSDSYDVLVVGARCAGASTAMLLARMGHRVGLVDRARFPSDTMSTHLVHPPGVAALGRWGLLGRLEATECPPVRRYSFDFGPFTIAGSPRPIEGIAHALCPRRTVLDRILVDAAIESGADLCEGFMVDEVTTSSGAVTGVRGHVKGAVAGRLRARVVVGADGRHSIVARTAGPEHYDERPSRLAMYYAYWSGLPVEGFETTIRVEQRRGWAAAPTHDGLTVLPFAWPIDEFHANRGDIERHFLAAIDLVPEFAERLRGARRESRFIGSAELPGWFRRPFGPGWALVGDAGYHKNPITAMGITDAFRDAELAAAAIDDALQGRRPYAEAMEGYRRVRDREARPIYEFTDDFARLEPPPPEMQRLFAAMQDDQAAMDGFVSVQAATLPAPVFFAPENVQRITERHATPA